jgi:hypothetical protein
MTNLEAKVFNDSARYALMLAEQLQEQAVRDNILKLVRVWLAAARNAEHAARSARAARQGFS